MKKLRIFQAVKLLNFSAVRFTLNPSPRDCASKLSTLPWVWMSGMGPICFLLVGLLAGCNGGTPSSDWDSLKGEIRNEFPSASTITTDELENWLSSAEKLPPLLFDARSPEEFSVSHLRGAESVSSQREALKVLESVEEDRRIVVYCSVGYRSAALVEALQERGFRNVYNLEGSIFEWANQGRPVYREGRQVGTVHPYDEKWGRFLDRDLWGWGNGK